MDLLGQQARSRAKPEFQAIILSGVGSQLGHLVEPHGDNATPKALIPVLNKPLVSYVLSWLEEASIKEALIVCPPKHVALLTDHIQSTSPVLKVDITSFESDFAGNASTAAILRKIAPKIHSDFIVLPCDFVPAPDMQLTTLLNSWRVDVSGMTMVALFYELSEEDRKDKGLSIPTIMFQEASLLQVNYGDDEQEEIPMHLLSNSRMSRKLVDSHVYIFKRTVLDLLATSSELRSVKKHLVPLLCSLQYSRTNRKKYSSVLVHPERETTSLNVEEKGSNALTAVQYSTLQELEWQTLNPRARPTTPITPAEKALEDGEDTSEGSDEDEQEDEDPLFVPSLRCGLVIERRGKRTFGRANTLSAYRDLNLKLLKDGSFDAKSRGDNVDPKAQISNDSLWSSTARIGEGSTVKHSVIGQHCVIGKRSHIVNSVIMEHAQIADGVRIENCIISGHTKIPDKAQLKGYESKPGEEIPSNSVAPEED